MSGAEKRLSTPIVLALASGMLAASAVIYYGATTSDAPIPEPSNAPNRPELRIDLRTPEAAAESFYDAWRRRRWTQALEVSVGEASSDVRNKMARDEAVPRADRIAAERAWDAIAQAPLTMALDRVDMLPDDQYALSGTAEYLFVGQPYRRRVAFLVVPVDHGYRVASMTLGEVITELPDIFQGQAPDGP